MEPMELAVCVIMVLAGVAMITSPAKVNANKRRKNDPKVLRLIRFTGGLMVVMFTAGIIYSFLK